MKRWLSVLIFVLTDVLAGGRSASFQIQTLGWDVYAFIGTYPLKVRIILSIQLSELILIDRLCGVRQPGCALYCDDLAFTQMYCDPICLPMTPQSQYIYCGSLNADNERFDGRNSSVAKRNGKQWSSRVSGSRPLLGEFWTDRFAVRTINEMRYAKELIANVEAMPLVSTVMFDRRLLSGYMGVFGLKPGPNSPVARLFETQQIPWRILSTSNGIQGMLPLRKPHAYAIFKFGSLDGAMCTGWQFVPAVSDMDWVIRVDSFDVLGLHFDEEILLTFRYGRSFLLIPEFAAERLVAEKRLQIWDEYALRSYAYRRTPGQPCRPPGPTKFRIGDVELTLADAVVTWTEHNDACGVSLQTDPTSSDNVWAMGAVFFNEHCLAFDYDRHMVGFARRRKPSILMRRIGD